MIQCNVAIQTFLNLNSISLKLDFLSTDLAKVIESHVELNFKVADLTLKFDLVSFAARMPTIYAAIAKTRTREKFSGIVFF